MSGLDRVRILVLGDSGVGKSSLVQLLSSAGTGTGITDSALPVQEDLSYTIGAAVEVKLHQYREGTQQQKQYWIGNSRELIYQGSLFREEVGLFIYPDVCSRFLCMGFGCFVFLLPAISVSLLDPNVASMLHYILFALFKFVLLGAVSVSF